MNGLMILSLDGDVGVTILPAPDSTELVVLYVQFCDLDLPPIPIPVAQLQSALEVWFGKPKA